MSNPVQKFVSETFGTIRARLIDGDAWFVGKDVAIALGYKDTKSALQDHVFDDYKRVLTNKIIAQMASQRKGGDSPPLDTTSPRGMMYINEAGLYQLIFSSKLPKAVDFQRWVFEEVLPAIRRQGYWQSVRDGGKVTRHGGGQNSPRHFHKLRI